MRRARVFDKNGRDIQPGDKIMVGTVKCEVFKAKIGDWVFLIACSMTKKPKVYRLGLASHKYVTKCV